jgi:hypothetical protein
MTRSALVHDADLLVQTLCLSTPHNTWRQRLNWGLCDSVKLVKLGRQEGATLWLHRRLASTGAALGPTARTELTNAVTAETAHCLRVDAEFARVAALLDNARIAFVPLKGTAMRAIADRVPFANARAPRDVDILCRHGDALRAWTILRNAGYHAPVDVPENHHHLPALVGQSGVGVDIHRTTVPEVTAKEAWRRATKGASSVVVAGRARVIPPDTELLWHALSHSLTTIDSVAHASLRLRHWLDASALIAAHADINWARVHERIASRECAHPALARAWLRVAFELAGEPPPTDLLTTTPPLDLVRLLAWRLQFTPSAHSRWKQKLLEEGTRCEAGLALEPMDSGRSLFVRARHVGAASASRLYWRMQSGGAILRA